MSYFKFHYENKGTIDWQNSAYMYVPIVNFPRSTIRCTPSYDLFFTINQPLLLLHYSYFQGVDLRTILIKVNE